MSALHKLIRNDAAFKKVVNTSLVVTLVAGAIVGASYASAASKRAKDAGRTGDDRSASHSPAKLNSLEEWSLSNAIYVGAVLTFVWVMIVFLFGVRDRLADVSNTDWNFQNGDSSTRMDDVSSRSRSRQGDAGPHEPVFYSPREYMEQAGFV